MSLYQPFSRLPPALADLAGALAKLPGIGPRSAERLALFVVQSDRQLAEKLAETLLAARDRIQFCSNCGVLTETSPCPICTATDRNGALLCVVERPVDVLLIEKAAAFEGKYHVLGGKISPLNGVEPEDLRIDALEQRISRENIREIIIALGTDVEGDATSHYLARRLAAQPVKISRIAYGLPAGTSLEYADELTLSRALEGRTAMNEV